MLPTYSPTRMNHGCSRRKDPYPYREEKEQQKSDAAHVDRHLGRKEHAAEKKDCDRTGECMHGKRREPTGLSAGSSLRKRLGVRVTARRKEPVDACDEYGKNGACEECVDRQHLDVRLPAQQKRETDEHGLKPINHHDRFTMRQSEP